MCVHAEGRWKPSFPHAGSGFSKPSGIMELFCSKGEQEGGWIRKNFILVIFFHRAMSHSSPAIALRLTRLLAVPPASGGPALVRLPAAAGPRQRSGGCEGQCSAKLCSDGGCRLEQHRQTPAVGNILLFGTLLWHPDLPTFHNPQMEKWHLK